MNALSYWNVWISNIQILTVFPALLPLDGVQCGVSGIEPDHSLQVKSDTVHMTFEVA